MSDAHNREKSHFQSTLAEVGLATGVLAFDLAVLRHMFTLAHPVVALAEAVGLFAVNKWALNRWTKRNRA